MLDPKTELANNHVEQFELSGSRIDSWGQANFGTKARKTAQNYEDYRRNNGEGLQFRPLNTENESGIHSPPLWTTSPPKSPVHPRHRGTNYRSLSPTSRTQAIARGQRELMEMVKNMPETCFELTLKDIVEQQRGETQEERLLKEQNYDDHLVGVHQRVSIKRQESKNSDKKAKMVRNGPVDNRGLFLKMVFPVSLNSKKKNLNSTSSKVSPKPEISDRTNSKGVDKDWWKKRFSVSSDPSESSRSSSKSGSIGSSGSRSSHSSTSTSTSTSGIRKKSSIMTRCLSCFESKKSKSTE